MTGQEKDNNKAGVFFHMFFRLKDTVVVQFTLTISLVVSVLVEIHLHFLTIGLNNNFQVLFFSNFAETCDCMFVSGIWTHI